MKPSYPEPLSKQRYERLMLMLSACENAMKVRNYAYMTEEDRAHKVKVDAKVFAILGEIKQELEVKA
jgi:hypothetical protein